MQRDVNISRDEEAAGVLVSVSFRLLTYSDE